MSAIDLATIAISAMILGLLLLGAVLLARRFAPPKVPHLPLAQEESHQAGPASSGAVLLVQSGGRVAYMSPEAREWFGLLGEEPNLERLARRTRPGDAFLALCAGQSPARFALHGRPVEGNAFAIPLEGAPAVLVSLRRPAQTGQEREQGLGPVNGLAAELSRWSIVDEFAQDVEKTIQAILDSAGRLVASAPDAAEIALWDTTRQILAPYRPTQAGEGPSAGWIWPAEVAVGWPESWVGTQAQAKEPATRRTTPFQSLLSLPLQINEERVGALALAWYSSEAFTSAEREALRLLAGPAALALQQARQRQREKHRRDELAALARLAAAGQAGEGESLFLRMVESLKTVLDVEALGFWIWDEQAGCLDAQSPFIGFSADFASLYHVKVPPGSPAEALLRAGKTIVASQAVQDERLQTLGLHIQAQAADFQYTVLLPLLPPRAGASALGYLQVADRRDGEPFAEEDLRLLAALAGQAAALIDSAGMAKAARAEERRAAILGRIAGLSGSGQNKLLRGTVQTLAGLVEAQAAGVILDEGGGWQLHTGSIIGPMEVSRRMGAWLAETAEQEAGAIRIEPGKDESAIPEGFLTWLGSSGLRSAVAAPLVFASRSLGVLLLGRQVEKAFGNDDISLIETAAGALAAVLQGTVQAGQTDDSLRQRAGWLEDLAQYSRELAALEDPAAVLQRLYVALRQASGARCGSVLLLADGGEENARNGDEKGGLRVALGVGEPHEESLSVLECQVIAGSEALIWSAGENTGTTHSPHQGVQTALLAPVVTAGGVVALINLHWIETGQFDPHSPIGQDILHHVLRLAGQSAGALVRARRNAALQWRAEGLARLLQAAYRPAQDQPSEETLADLARALQVGLPCAWVTISSVEKAPGSPLRLLASAGTAGAGPKETETPSAPVGWAEVEAELQPERRENEAYWLPGDELWLPIWEGKLPGGTFSEASGVSPLGLLRLGGLIKGSRPGEQVLELVELAGRLAGLSLAGQRQVETLQQAATEAQVDLERSRRAAETAQARLPALLRKDLESTRAIQQLSWRAGRLRAGLDFAAQVDQQTDRAGVYAALAEALRVRLDHDVVLVVEPSPTGPHLACTLGTVSAGVNPAALLGQLNPLRSLLETDRIPAQTGVMQAELAHSSEWRSSPLLRGLETHSFVCFAIPGASYQSDINAQDAGPVAAVLAVRQRPPDAENMAGQSGDDEALALVDLLARQAALALHNLRLVEQTGRSLQEVHTLLAFSRRLGSLVPSALLQALLESAMELLPAAQAGWVAVWEAQAEGSGLAPQTVAGYQDAGQLRLIRFPVESLPGKTWKSNQPQLLADVNFTTAYPLAPEDLVRYRDATGGRLPVACLVLPVGTKPKESGPQLAGTAQAVLVLDNFRESGAFSAQDEALIVSLAQQTALALEAARLYQAAEGRAVQLQALTEVATKLTARLDTAGLVGSLLDLARAVVPYETAALWLRGGWGIPGGSGGSGGAGGDRFTIRAAQGFEDSTRRIGLSVMAAESLLLRDLTATSAGQPVVVHDVRRDSRFSALVEPHYLSWLGIPLIVKEEVIGVIALEKSQAHYYTSDHLQAVATFAAQASAALDSARLYEESLARAAELDSRTNRLVLLNRLSTELSGSLDATFILQLTLQELLLALNAAGGCAVLFDAAGETLLQAEAPKSTPGEFPVLLPDAPIFEHLRGTLGVFSLADLYDEQGRWNEPRLAPLQNYLSDREARALLILPLATGTAGTADLHGLLFIHQPMPYSFTPEEVELARTISNQAAVAAQNAALFQETQWLFAETRQRSAELATLFDLGVHIAQVLDRQKLIDLTFENILHLMQVDSVGLVLRDDAQDGGESELVAQAVERGERIGPLNLPEGGGSFSEHVLHTGQPLLINDSQRERENLPKGVTVGEMARSWLGVPLMVRGTVTGVLAAQSAEPDHFSDSHLRLLRQIGNQLAVALDNARLFATVQSYAADLEQRVSERTAQLGREHQRTQTLLGIITELSTSLDMDIVLNRTLALINETVGAEHSMIVLVLPDETTLYLRATLGYATQVPKGGQPTGLRPNASLAGWVITQRQPALVPDLYQDSRWTEGVSSEAGSTPRSLLAGLPAEATVHRSALAVPLMMGEETLGALLLFHDQPQHFSYSQLDLVQATAKQIAVAINNAQLYTLIRDQAERLGDMLRLQHVETSRSQAILEAVADGVLVTDAERVVTLFNASAERILDLPREKVIGISLEHFLGLFGKAGQTWMDTIQRWSEDPGSIAPEEDYSYSEQIELEDMRVVSVHLSPVRLRNDFLGTVSTFRDITHQVVVDRLKSEFVATVSHELRTPMTSIKGYVEILLMGAAGELTTQQMRFLEIVRANTERLSVLVNDLLDLSRIEAGRVALSLQPIDLRQLAHEALADLERRNQKDGKDMEIQLHLPPELPRVLGDAERLHQILDNLLDNAYAYTPAGGSILLRLDVYGDEVQVEVQDNGIGIQSEDQPRIFERFYRGEDPLVLATSGAGLGLSIVRHLVEMHNGRIWVQSPVDPAGELGPGSRFTFTLPTYQAEDE